MTATSSWEQNCIRGQTLDFGIRSPKNILVLFTDLMPEILLNLFQLCYQEKTRAFAML